MSDVYAVWRLDQYEPRRLLSLWSTHAGATAARAVLAADERAMNADVEFDPEWDAEFIVEPIQLDTVLT